MKSLRFYIVLVLFSPFAQAQAPKCAVEARLKKAAYEKIKSCLSSLGEPENRQKDPKGLCKASLHDFIKATNNFFVCAPSSDSEIGVSGIKTVAVDGQGPCLHVLNNREKALIKVKSCIDNWNVLTQKPPTPLGSDCQDELSIFYSEAMGYIQCLQGKSDDIVKETSRLLEMIRANQKQGELCPDAQTNLDIQFCLAEEAKVLKEKLKNLRVQFVDKHSDLKPTYSNFELRSKALCDTDLSWAKEKYKGGSMAGGESQSGLIRCERDVLNTIQEILALEKSTENFQEVDKKLNTEYQNLLSAYRKKGFKVRIKNASTAQAAWIKYRDASTKLAKKIWSKDPEVEQLSTSVATKLTSRRTKKFQDELKEHNELFGE